MAYDDKIIYEGVNEAGTESEIHFISIMIYCKWSTEIKCIACYISQEPSFVFVGVNFNSFIISELSLNITFYYDIYAYKWEFHLI